MSVRDYQMSLRFQCWTRSQLRWGRGCQSLSAHRRHCRSIRICFIEVVPAIALPSSPLSGRSSSSSSQTLAWGDVDDSSAPLSPNRVQAGCSQDVPDEGSLFNVSPVSPGFLFRPSRGDQPPPSEGVPLPTTIDDFDYSVLGDPIT